MKTEHYVTISIPFTSLIMIWIATLLKDWAEHFRDLYNLAWSGTYFVLLFTVVDIYVIYYDKLWNKEEGVR